MEIIILGSIIAASLIAISAALWYMLLSNRTISPLTPDRKSPNIRIKNINLTATASAKNKESINTTGKMTESTHVTEVKNNEKVKSEKTTIQLNPLTLGKMHGRNEDFNLRKRVLQKSHIVGRELSNEIIPQEQDGEEQDMLDASEILDSVNDKIKADRSQYLSEAIKEFTDPSIEDVSVQENRSWAWQPFNDTTPYSRESSLKSTGERALYSQDADSAIGSCDGLSSTFSYMHEWAPGNLVQPKHYKSESPTQSKHITVTKEGCEFSAPYGQVNFPVGTVEESTGITITPHYECQQGLDKRMFITPVIEFQSASTMEFLKPVQVLFYTPYSAAESGKPVNVELMRKGHGSSIYHPVQTTKLDQSYWIQFWTKQFCRLGVAVRLTDRVHTKKRYYSAAIVRDTTLVHHRVVSWMICEDMPNVKELNKTYFEATDNQRVIDAESFEVGYEYNLRLKLSSQGIQFRPGGDKTHGFQLDIDEDTFSLPLHQQYCTGFDKKSQIHLSTNEKNRFMLKLRYQACAIGFDSEIRDREIFDQYCYLDWSTKEQPVTQINASGAGSSGIRMDIKQVYASEHDTSVCGGVRNTRPQHDTSGYAIAENVQLPSISSHELMRGWEAVADSQCEAVEQLMQEEYGEYERGPASINASVDMSDGSNKLELPTFPEQRDKPPSPESHHSDLQRKSKNVMHSRQDDSSLLAAMKITNCDELRDHPQPLPRKKRVSGIVTDIKLGDEDEESLITKSKHNAEPIYPEQ